MSETLLGDEPSWLGRWLRCFEFELHLKAKRSSDAISEQRDICGYGNDMRNLKAVASDRI